MKRWTDPTTGQVLIQDDAGRIFPDPAYANPNMRQAAPLAGGYPRDPGYPRAAPGVYQAPAPDSSFGGRFRASATSETQGVSPTIPKAKFEEFVSSSSQADLSDQVDIIPTDFVYTLEYLLNIGNDLIGRHTSGIFYIVMPDTAAFKINPKLSDNDVDELKTLLGVSEATTGIKVDNLSSAISRKLTDNFNSAQTGAKVSDYLSDLSDIREHHLIKDVNVVYEDTLKMLLDKTYQYFPRMVKVVYHNNVNVSRELKSIKNLSGVTLPPDSAIWDLVTKARLKSGYIVGEDSLYEITGEKVTLIYKKGER